MILDSIDCNLTFDDLIIDLLSHLHATIYPYNAPSFVRRCYETFRLKCMGGELIPLLKIVYCLQMLRIKQLMLLCIQRSKVKPISMQTLILSVLILNVCHELMVPRRQVLEQFDQFKRYLLYFMKSL